jgi:hypothetical protein
VGFGNDVVFTREGGSIGVVPVMERALQAPVVFFGLSLPEHGYHGPNGSSIGSKPLAASSRSLATSRR